MARKTIVVRTKDLKTLDEVFEKEGQKRPRPKFIKRPVGIIALERRYFKDILKLINPMFTAVRKHTLTGIGKAVSEFNATQKVDGYGFTISAFVVETKRDFTINFTDKRVFDVVEKNADSIERTNMRHVNKVMDAALNVNVLLDQPYLEDTIDSFIESNVSLIKTIPDEHFRRVETLVRENVLNGRSTREITDLIKREFEISKNKAKLIARDQVGKLYGKLTELRYKEIGIDRYRWSTSRDERVRSTHKTRHGTVRSWDKPPADGHPGIPIQCRCVAIPIFEGF